MFETTMPTMKITPSSDWTLMAVFGQVEHRHHADQAQRHGEEDDERRHVRLEQGRHQEVDQQRRQDQAEAQAAEGLLHARILAAELDRRALDHASRSAE